MRLPCRMLRRRLLPCLTASALIGCCLWLAVYAPLHAADQSKAAAGGLKAPPANKIIKKANDVAASPSVDKKVPANQNWRAAAAANRGGDAPPPNYGIHIFYYPWYGNPDTDGAWIHWNHPRLRHWNAETARHYSQKTHAPPADIGANFYPSLGPYSSANVTVVRLHFEQIRRAGIGTVVVSWYPPGTQDDNGRPVDQLVPMLLAIALEFQLRIALHIEPYADRTPVNFAQHLRYITTTHAGHPAFYRHRLRDGRSLPVHYVYDSYRIPRSLWRPVLGRGGAAGTAAPASSRSIRGSPYDALVLGLAMEATDCQTMKEAGFDGAYTYFAADGFTHASTRSNWEAMGRSCASAGLAFAPSVGPGYVDTAVRPWNAATSRDRQEGRYYTDGLRTAAATRPAMLTITSFNEWHEGTQIEPAVPRVGYLDYAPSPPDHYLQLTALFSATFTPSDI